MCLPDMLEWLISYLNFCELDSQPQEQKENKYQCSD